MYFGRDRQKDREWDKETERQGASTNRHKENKGKTERKRLKNQTPITSFYIMLLANLKMGPKWGRILLIGYF